MTTEHPKLFILEDVARAGGKFDEVPLTSSNLDIFTYINSKFVYVEKIIRKQLVDMYYDILKSKCELEQRVLKNALSIATINSIEFGFSLMKEKGFMGIKTGEVVHLVKCLRIEVKERPTRDCYNELPVTWKEENYYLAPKIRILLRTGTRIHCDLRLPSMFKMTPDIWYKSLPNVRVKADTPEILKPQTKPTWTYNAPETLALGGIYGDNDTHRIRNLIVFPAERPAILNRVALGITSRHIYIDDMTPDRFFGPDSVKKLIENYYANMWSGFMSFGTASAGIIGMFMVFRFIKLIVDTIIHGYAIYSLYGFSVHLIGAIWNSVTQLLLHLVHQADNKKKEKTTADNKKEPEKNMRDENKEELLPLQTHRGNNIYPPITVTDKYERRTI